MVLTKALTGQQGSEIWTEDLFTSFSSMNWIRRKDERLVSEHQVVLPATPETVGDVGIFIIVVDDTTRDTGGWRVHSLAPRLLPIVPVRTGH